MLNSLSLLPLSASELEAGLASCLAALETAGLSQEEAFLKISSLFESWLEADGQAAPLPVDLRPLLAAASWITSSPTVAHTTYLELVRKIERRYAGTRREAVVILSHMRLMLMLGREFANSPAKIASVIGSASGRSPVTWRAVQVILNYFKIPSKLDETAVIELLARDSADSTDELRDADIATIVQVLSQKSAAFGLPSEFSESISRLFATDGAVPFIPYLQALLYVAVIDHFYDHPPEFIYTFNPRGNAANRIFDSFPSTLAPGGNPILNNFKALDRLTHDWAESREDTRTQATALVTIILGMSSLSFAARRDFSAAVRRAIFRFIEISTPSEIILPEITTISEIRTFLGNVSATPTGTKGIIEQRVTDFLAAMQHTDSAWRSRGLGDPVNASNSSSRKLGDCDFQNAAERICDAVESHAGRLTDIYVDEHLRTLRLNLPKRLEEWSGISEVEDWTLKLTFLVHEDARSSPGVAHLDVQFEMDVMTFRELSDRVLAASENDAEITIRIFNRLVVYSLNSRNTPHTAKEKARALFSASA